MSAREPQDPFWTLLGLTLEEQTIPRESLYLADEMFFTGTAGGGNGQCPGGPGNLDRGLAHAAAGRGNQY